LRPCPVPKNYLAVHVQLISQNNSKSKIEIASRNRKQRFNFEFRFLISSFEFKFMSWKFPWYAVSPLKMASLHYRWGAPCRPKNVIMAFSNFVLKKQKNYVYYTKNSWLSGHGNKINIYFSFRLVDGQKWKSRFSKI